MDKLITPRECAEQLRVTVGTLSVWRSTKRYPLKYVKVGEKVLYRQGDVEKFIEAGASR